MILKPIAAAVLATSLIAPTVQAGDDGDPFCGAYLSLELVNMAINEILTEYDGPCRKGSQQHCDYLLYKAIGIHEIVDQGSHLQIRDITKSEYDNYDPECLMDLLKEIEHMKSDSTLYADYTQALLYAHNRVVEKIKAGVKLNPIENDYVADMEYRGLDYPK